MSTPPKNTFIPRLNRSAITREPDTQGRWSPQYPEMMGFANQGGGSLPKDFAWDTNPKQWQEELTEAELRQERAARGLPHGS